MESQAEAPPVCYRHPDRPTRVSCSDCGRPICPDCTIDAAVGQKCPECATPEGRHRTVVVRDRWRVGFATAPVTLTLIVLNVLIFVLGRSPEVNADLVRDFAQVKPLVADGEWWRVISAAFLHGSLFHVGINMYILYLLGPQLERQVGSATFLALYLASAATGGAVSQLTDLDSGFVISLGASGAIFGLFGTWFSASYRSRHTPAGRAMFNQMLVLLAINAAFPLFAANIDWRAHLGGFVAGVAIHQLWIRIAPEGAHSRPRRALIALAVGAMAVAAVIVLA